MGQEEKIDSTSDDRVKNNSTRQQYRVLSEEEKASVDWLKGNGEAFIQHCRELQKARPEAGREFALAITHAEDAVMRAVRGITQ